MKAAIITQFGDANTVFEIRDDIALPVPKPGEVRIKLYATSVNPVDYKRRKGYAKQALRLLGITGFPLILGSDIAGEVDSLGSGVNTFAVGNKVWGVKNASRFGTYAEYVCCAAKDLCLMPSLLTFEQAAALPFVGLTTWTALVTQVGLTEKNTRNLKILVHAGAGGVGSFAIQFLKAWGATVATTCSTKNIEFCKNLGADEVIDYTTTHFKEKLSEFDGVLNTVGISLEDDSLSILKKDGKAFYVNIVHPLFEIIGKDGLLMGGFKALFLMAKKKCEQCLKGRRYYWSIFRNNPHGLAIITALVEQAKIKPVINCVLPLERIVAAHELSETQHTAGKIIIKLNK